VTSQRKLPIGQSWLINQQTPFKTLTIHNTTEKILITGDNALPLGLGPFAASFELKLACTNRTNIQCIICKQPSFKGNNPSQT
jgi:hypothetical protein